MAMSPNQGAPGSGFKVGWSGFTFGADCKDTTVQVLWDGQTQIGSGPTTRGIGSAGASVPGGAAAGGHLVVADAVCGNSIARGIFTVVVPPPTTTVPPPTTNPPVTTIPPVTTQPPNTTKPPGVPTTTPPTTADPSSSVPPSSSSNSSVPVGVHSGTDGALTLDKDNIQPGDPLTATGTGCAPGSEVRLSSLNESVGTARADSTGRFSAPVEFATIQPGRHTIRAQCDIVLLGSVDVALTTSAAGGTTSTLVVLLFFLLIGATMLRRQFSALRIPAKTR